MKVANEVPLNNKSRYITDAMDSFSSLGSKTKYILTRMVHDPSSLLTGQYSEQEAMKFLELLYKSIPRHDSHWRGLFQTVTISMAINDCVWEFRQNQSTGIKSNFGRSYILNSN